MNYASQTFVNRFNRLGDEAESVFEQWANEHHIEFERYGLTRPKLSRFWTIEPFIRKTPDYLCMGTHPFLCEVKGTGRAGHVKVKEADFTTMFQWNTYLPLWIFIYDNAQSQVSFISLAELAALRDEDKKGVFHEGNVYYRILKSQLEWQDIVIPEGTAHGY